MASAKEKTPGQLLKALPLGGHMSLGRIAQGGSLEARRINKGVMFYWRYTVGGKTDRVAVGVYDPRAPVASLEIFRGGYSVEAAKREAERMAQKHRVGVISGQGGYREQQASEAAAKKASDAAAKALKDHTLQGLLQDYCDYLKSLNRRSYKDAENMFKLHVVEADAKLAASPACMVTQASVIGLQRRLIKAEHRRTANKLRSYLGAAYQTALRAASSASIPDKFLGYGVSVNPVAGTVRDAAADKADKNPINTAELRTYWGIIRDVPGIKGVALRLHLLMGGPRIEQLVNVKVGGLHESYMELFDGKGRPGKAARSHVVPLVGQALEDVKTLDLAGEWLLSTDGGETHIAATTLSDWAKALVGDKIKKFQAKRIRSGVETYLASVGISEDTRKRLQSHGLGGVQSMHYDAHDYMSVKVKALEALQSMLTATTGSNVVAIKAPA